MRTVHRTGVMAAIVGLLLSAAIAVADDSILLGTDGPDTINGTPAADSIYGRAGDDKISGAGGDDELDGGSGADLLAGGEGTDAVSYSGATPVDASLDGASANDGATGEKDTIASDVEDLYGGDGGDKLTGNDGPNTIDGGAGDDRITGGKGADVLVGDEGDDVIDARDGEADRIECGAGNDTATIDAVDVVAADCENAPKQAVTIKPGITIKPPQRKIIVSSIVSKSKIVIACPEGCGKFGPSKAVVQNDSVKLQPGRVAILKLNPAIRGKLIEVGVRAPGSSPVCTRYKIDRSYRYKVLVGQACTSVAKDV